MPTILDAPIGILGGTFNPVHNCHIKIAEAILPKFKLASIYFLPCYQPVHRHPPEASALDRVNMLKLALKQLPAFRVDLREIERKEPSYMIDTLISLRQDYPHTPLCLIIGNDAYSQITTWKSWDELLNFSHFIVINRDKHHHDEQPHSSLKQFITHDETDLQRYLAGKIYLFQITPCLLSATDIRDKIKKHEDITSLVPIDVARYIAKKKLYL